MAAEVAEISSSCFSASWPWEIIQNRSSNVYHVLPSIPQGCPGKNDFPWMVDLTPVPSQNLWMPNHLLKMAAKLEPNPPVAQPPSCHSLLCQPPQRVVLQITNALLRPCEVMVSYSSQSQRLQTGWFTWIGIIPKKSKKNDFSMENESFRTLGITMRPWLVVVEIILRYFNWQLRLGVSLEWYQMYLQQKSWVWYKRGMPPFWFGNSPLKRVYPKETGSFLLYYSTWYIAQRPHQDI